MSRSAAFCGVMRWSASGSRTGALVMGGTVVAVTVSGSHLILVIWIRLDSADTRLGGALRRALRESVPGPLISDVNPVLHARVQLG